MMPEKFPHLFGEKELAACRLNCHARKMMGQTWGIRDDGAVIDASLFVILGLTASFLIWSTDPVYQLYGVTVGFTMTAHCTSVHVSYAICGYDKLGWNPAPYGIGYLFPVGTLFYITSLWRILDPVFPVDRFSSAPLLLGYVACLVCIHTYIQYRIVRNIPRLRATLHIHWAEREVFETNGRQFLAHADNALGFEPNYNLQEESAREMGTINWMPISAIVSFILIIYGVMWMALLGVGVHDISTLDSDPTALNIFSIKCTFIHLALFALGMLMLTAYVVGKHNENLVCNRATGYYITIL